MNLNVEIVHSQTYLRETLSDIKDIFNSSIGVFKDADKINIHKDDGMHKLRKKVNDHRDDMDYTIDCIMYDYQLYKDEISDIYKNRKDEKVVYSIRVYKQLYYRYKENYKDYKKIYNKLYDTVRKDLNDKKYNKFIYLNKIMTPLYKSLKIMEGCKYSLEKLLGIKTKKEEES